ncbi:hypothetical protein RND81_03G065300 [Saponaria officinalis]|uniref:Retrovirus-related Pol polyprotein from transposon TNT 1-94-like beta-barrel domain-containing protein n=1 Tax=Saponaria officinalis TaxID=3572 RepID=A0AAW1M588_SAPOF
MNNDQVITWILQNVSERIKMVIIYTPTAKGIWDVLEKRYTVTNGARKFKLNKETYEISQQGRLTEEYYTQLQMVWDELHNMCTLPTISKITLKVAEYLKAMETQAEEKRLFLFLNGLDKEYGILRSSILLMDPLPTVENAVSLMLQEEIQSSNLGRVKQQEMSALMSKGEFERKALYSNSTREKCVHCGRDNHKSEMCWEIKGYLVGHPRHKKPYQKTNFRNTSGGTFKQQRSYQGNNRQGNHSGEVKYHKKTAANVKAENSDLTSAIGAATQQLENLLKMVPGSHSSYKLGGESEEEIECNFAGMIHQFNQTEHKNEWVIDSGATDRMTPYFDILADIRIVNDKPNINLPNGGCVKVTHKGDVALKNGLMLKNVLFVPEFKQNLMSVQKLIKDNECKVMFLDSYYCVQGSSDGKIKRLGK